MLLHKTSWRIKRFISPKKNSGLDKSDKDFDDGRIPRTKYLTSTPKRLSWLSQTSSSYSPPLQRANSNATRRGHQKVPSGSTARSSASSLCSCDCGGANAEPIEHSLFGVEPLPPLPDILYLPTVSPENASPDAKTWRLIFHEPLSRPLTPELRLGTTVALTLGLGRHSDTVNNLPPGLIDNDKTPTQSLKYTGESDMEDHSDDVERLIRERIYSNNVEQLIRETDEAFQAVDSALADAKIATQGWHENSSGDAFQPASISHGILRGRVKPALKSPTLRSVSVSKRPGKKRTLFGKSTPKVPLPQADTPARWTLPDVATNMSKIFRTSADEMLTPGRILQMKNEKAESARKISTESARTFETEDSSTPTEPFHLESLNTRITAAALQDTSPVECPILPPPAIPQASPRSSMQTVHSKSLNSHITAAALQDTAPVPYKILPPPAIPQASPRSSTQTVHSRSLNSRITAAALQETAPVPCPILPPPAIPQASPRSSTQTPPPRPPRPDESPPAIPQASPRTSTQTPPPRPPRPDESPNQSRAGMIFDSFTFPTPPIPPRAPRRSSASKVASLLPTIPEISPLHLTPTHNSFPNSDSSASSSRPSLSIPPPLTQVLLPSTKFTLTSPLFRHGPIRIDRLLRGRKGSDLEEQALDWIAFQMAIAGTTELDEHFGDMRDDAQWEADETEIDDMIDWWNSLGYKNYGRMENEIDVREKDGYEAIPVPRFDTPRRIPGRQETQRGDSEYMQKRTWRTWTDTPPPPVSPARNNNASRTPNWKNGAHSPETPKPSPAAYTKPAPPAQQPNLTILPAPPRRPSVAESLLSLPPSPMLDLVVPVQAGKDDEVPIPMGFNLGHDLGDFLSWEARHVQSMYLDEKPI